MKMMSLNEFKSGTCGINARLNHSVTKPTSTKFKIFRCNDSHGNSDQLMGLAEAGKSFKQKNSLDKDVVCLNLSGGDNVSGADIEKNKFVFDILQNVAGVEVSAVGNHEFDAGAKGFYEAVKDKKMQFVASNVKFSQDNPIKDIVKPSLIKEQNGVKFGYVGTMPLDFEMCTKKQAQEGVEVMDMDDSIEAIQEEINKLKQQGVDKIIMLSHCGYETDKELVQNLDGVDIVIGGHSHSVVEGAEHGENLLTSKSGEPVLITQTGENGKYYGVVDVEFSDKGVITKVSNETVASNNTKRSPIIEFVKTKMLGFSPYVAKLEEVDEMPKNRRVAVCAWTNVLADSMRAKTKTDIALVNAANTRKVPQEGNITQRDVFESSPMKNKILTTQITQKDLVNAIKEAAKTSMTSKEGEPGILHGSGFSYKIDKQGNLLEMSVADKKGKMVPIDINNPSEKVVYSATYDDFVAKKDGEYPLLFPKFKTKEYDFDKAETMIEYLSNRPDKDNLVIKDDKRIEIV